MSTVHKNKTQKSMHAHEGLVSIRRKEVSDYGCLSVRFNCGESEIQVPRDDMTVTLTGPCIILIDCIDKIRYASDMPQIRNTGTSEMWNIRGYQRAIAIVGAR